MSSRTPASPYYSPATPPPADSPQYSPATPPEAPSPYYTPGTPPPARSPYYTPGTPPGSYYTPATPPGSHYTPATPPPPPPQYDPASADRRSYSPLGAYRPVYTPSWYVGDFPICGPTPESLWTPTTPSCPDPGSACSGIYQPTASAPPGALQSPSHQFPVSPRQAPKPSPKTPKSQVFKNRFA